MSLLGYGSGGPSNLGQSTGLSPKEQAALIKRCLSLGINLFDTAAVYHRSEEILGKALKSVPRESYIIVTKWKHDISEEQTKSPQELSASMENSLSRLGTDHVDVMLFHGVSLSQYPHVVERYYPAMKRLQEEGKTRFIGFSEWYRMDPGHRAAELALKTHPDLWDVIMLKYGILNQYAAKEVFPLALQHGVGILDMAAVRVMLQRPDQLEDLIAEWKRRGRVPADSLPATNPLGWLVHGDVDSVISAGYKFAADHPAMSSVLTGTSNVAHLENNAAALEKPFLEEPDKQRLIELFGELDEHG